MSGAPFMALLARSSAFGFIAGPLTLGSSVATGPLSGFTIKETFMSAALTPPPSAPNLIRVTIKAHPTTPTQFDSVWIGPRLGSGDVYDVTAFTQLFFSGSAGVTIAGGTSVVSDAAAFAWDRSTGLVCSAFFGVHAGNNGVASSSILNASNFFDREQTGDESSLANGTSGATNAGSILSFSAIETNGF